MQSSYQYSDELESEESEGTVDIDSETSDDEGSPETWCKELCRAQPFEVDVECEENVFGSLALACLKKTNKKWHKRIGPLASSCFLVTCTLVTQALFTFYLIPTIAKDEYKEKYSFETDSSQQDKNLFAAWRSSKIRGAQHADTLSNSTAFYACTGEAWSWEQTIIEDLQKLTSFVNDTPSPISFLMSFVVPGRWRQGTVFGICALLLWAAAIMKALRNVAAQSMMLFMANGGVQLTMFQLMCWPLKDCLGLEDTECWKFQHCFEATLEFDSKSAQRHKNKKDLEKKKQMALFNEDRQKEGQIIMQDVQRQNNLDAFKEYQRQDKFDWDTSRFKITLLSMVVFRTLIILGIGFYGVTFLSHVDNLKDFILDSIALAFVLEIPDLVFTAFASLRAKKLVSHRHDVARRFKVPGLIARYAGAASFIICLLMVWQASTRMLIPSMKGLQNDALGALCRINPKGSAETWDESAR